MAKSVSVDVTLGLQLIDTSDEETDKYIHLELIQVFDYFNH